MFQPYRKWLMNEIFNKRLLPSIGVYRVKAVLRDPEITDPDEMKSMLDYLADRGVLTVRDLIPFAEKVLGTVIDESRYPEGYLDSPIIQLIQNSSSFD